MTDREQLIKDRIQKIKGDIARENSWIDSELDKMGFGHEVDNKEELYAKQDQLMDTHQKMRNYESELEEINKRIIESKSKISELELEKNQLLDRIEKDLNKIR